MTTRGRGRPGGLALMLSSAASNQAGASMGAAAFPVIGPVGVVAVRQVLTALVLVVAIRPPLRGRTARQWTAVVALALSFIVMNLALYTAVSRIGLGLAVTLEFLGPIGVAVAGARGVRERLCAVAVAAGVVVLMAPGPSSDLLGFSAALLAAAGWAVYILANARIGRTLPGLQGTAIAALLGGTVWAPVGVAWFATHPPTLAALGLAGGCALLSSIAPYAIDLLALRRVPAHLFGVVAASNPIFAGLAGWLVLGQQPEPHQAVGTLVVVVSSVILFAGPQHRGGDRTERIGGEDPGPAVEG